MHTGGTLPGLRSRPLSADARSRIVGALHPTLAHAPSATGLALALFRVFASRSHALPLPYSKDGRVYILLAPGPLPLRCSVAQRPTWPSCAIQRTWDTTAYVLNSLDESRANIWLRLLSGGRGTLDSLRPGREYADRRYADETTGKTFFCLPVNLFSRVVKADFGGAPEARIHG